MAQFSGGYGAAVQIVHWFSVLLVSVAWVLGTVGEDLPRGRARDLGELIHVSAGELIAILLICFVSWSLASNQRAAVSRTDAAGEIWAIWPPKSSTLRFTRCLRRLSPWASRRNLPDGDALSVLGIFDIASPWTKNKTCCT